jgi:hypothetical protein
LHHIVEELPAIVGEFISGLVIGIIADCKGFKKIFGKKNNTIKNPNTTN